MEGFISGINIAYSGYYFSNGTGSVQLLTYTSKALVEEYQTVMEDLLNGIVLMDE
jgi:hypothetical protein